MLMLSYTCWHIAHAAQSLLVNHRFCGVNSVLGLPQGVEPVLRTYNTLIIACNMCNQPREAMTVHRRMLNEGYTPNATTYNALISAYGKAGQLDKVMEVSISCIVLCVLYMQCFCQH